MKLLVIILLLSLLGSCKQQKSLFVSSDVKSQILHQYDYRKLVDRINGIYIPKDLDEAVDSLDVLIGAEEKRYISDSLSMEDFCAFQHLDGWGIWMRNEWGLWSGSRLQQYFMDKGIVYPDDMSGVILEAYYCRKIKGQEYVIKEAEEPPTLPEVTTKKPQKSNLGTGDFWYEELAIGDTLYFSYPFGCSTREEQDIWHEADGSEFLPKGKIVDIRRQGREVKIKLFYTISPYGIIVFDGDVEPDTQGVFERDFRNFTVHSPNRFYMQKGDELWFDMNSDFWDTEWIL